MATFLKTKRLGWALIFLLVTAVGVLSYLSGRRYVAAMGAVEHTLAVESGINATLSLLKDAESGQRGFILSGDALFLEPHELALREIPPHVARLTELSNGDSAQASRLRQVRQLIDEKLSFVAETIRLRRDGNLPRAMELVRSGRGKQLMDDIRAQARLMLDHEERRLRQRKAEAHRAEVTATWGVGVGSALTITFALISLLTVQRDVNELKRAAEELAKSEEYYRLLTEQSSDLVRVLALTGKASYVSPSVEHLLGYTVGEYLALAPSSLMHPDEQAAELELCSKVRSGAATGGLSTYRLRHKNGEYRWFEVRWGARSNEEGVPVELHTAGRDVTERRAAEARLSAYAEQLKDLSLRDELTGLYNRRGFLAVSAQAHSLALRDGRPAALIFVDLNGMKRINDELGHDMGDAALVDTADVLVSAVHESDVVARLGGDEFVVFSLDFVAADLDKLRVRLRKLADARVAESDRPFRISMSVGAAYMPVGSQISIEDLLDEADVAMYAQKNARRAAGGISLVPVPVRTSGTHKLF